MHASTGTSDAFKYYLTWASSIVYIVIWHKYHVDGSGASMGVLGTNAVYFDHIIANIISMKVLQFSLLCYEPLQDAILLLCVGLIKRTLVSTIHLDTCR